MSHICQICGNTEQNQIHMDKEMMFGFRDEFEYLECGKCGCVQIINIPDNILKYYPDSYYSFNIHPEIDYKKVKHRIKSKLVDSYNITGKGVLGKHFSKKRLYRERKKDYEFLIGKINKTSKIIDIGCGNGTLPYILKNAGFKNVMGLDPFIKADIKYKNGVIILKKQLAMLDTKFDFIVLNHSFEHMDNPLTTMQNLSNLLEDNGQICIRIPIASSYAWQHYKTNWFQLDAPRHFYLHTVKSLSYLAEKSNMYIEDMTCDSIASQFWGSEQYLKDIPLLAGLSHALSPHLSVFTKNEIDEFTKRANELNKIKQGDQAIFIIKKKNNDLVKHGILTNEQG